jgi:hypothetical protein
MAYAAISTQNNSGLRPLPGSLRSLGCCAGLYGTRKLPLGQAYSVSDLTSAGVDPSVASSLIAMDGAGLVSDAQLAAVISNPDSEDAGEALYEQAVAAQSSAASAGAAPAAAIPVGTVLQYTATAEAGFTTWTAAGVISKIISWLQGNYPQLTVQSNSTGTSPVLSTSITLSLVVQVVSGGGFASATDVQSILNSAVSNTVGGLGGSSIGIVSMPQAGAALNPYVPPGTPAITSAATETFTQWFENNWGWVAAGVGVLVVGGVVANKLV